MRSSAPTELRFEPLRTETAANFITAHVSSRLFALRIIAYLSRLSKLNTSLSSQNRKNDGEVGPLITAQKVAR